MASKCRGGCGKWTDNGPFCLFCDSDIGWESPYPLPVDVYIAKELGYLEAEDKEGVGRG